jgi:hypothetical protein
MMKHMLNEMKDTTKVRWLTLMPNGCHVEFKKLVEKVQISAYGGCIGLVPEIVDMAEAEKRFMEYKKEGYKEN